MQTFRAPAYVGVEGLGGAVLSAFQQAVTRPLAAPPFWATPSDLCLAAPGQHASRSEPLGLALLGLDGWPPSDLSLHSVGLGAFPAQLQLRPGGNCWGLRCPRAAA